MFSDLVSIARNNFRNAWAAISPSPKYVQFRRIRPVIESIPGLLSEGQELWLYARAYDLPRNSTIVEIGSYKGRSTTALAYGCLDTGKHIFCIDTFDGNESDFTGQGRRGFFSEWKNNIESAALTEYVTPIVSHSQEASKGWDREIDFLFVDGSHVYEDVLADFDNFFPFVVRGGTIAMHDVGSHEGCTRVWKERNYLLSEKGYVANLAFGIKK